MQLDWWLGLAGGLLIGAAASLLWLLYGRILGVSGVVAGLWQQTGGERAWRVWFVAGVLLSGLLYRLSFGLPEISLSYPWWWLALAGFLVGVGTRMGSGCTSGHGVCGLGRLSVRSVWAVLVFIGSGVLTVTVLRHVLGVM